MPTIAAEPYEYRFPAGRLALIVIDMQRDFVEEGGFGSVLGNDVRPLAAIVPTAFLLMLPYLLALLAVAGVVGRLEPPTALTLPFQRGK